MKARPLTTDEHAHVCSVLVGARTLRPYYGRALAALTPVAVDGLGTVAVDRAWRLYLDPTWLSTLPPRQAAGVIACHEVEHLLRAHPARLKAIACPTFVGRIASDAEINDDADPVDLPPGGVRPADFGCTDGETLEVYARALLDAAGAGSEPRPACGGGSGVGAPEEWELPSGESAPDWAPAVDELAAQHVCTGTAADVRAYVAEHGRGAVPAGVAVWADAHVRAPVLDWRGALAVTLRRATGELRRGRDDYSWARLSRRARPGAPLRPGLRQYPPRVGVVVDTSGSMFNEGQAVKGVVWDLARRVGRVRVWAVDAEITAAGARVRAGQSTPAGGYRGGGGTDLRTAISDAADASDLLVVVTDGETPWPASKPRVPVVVALTPGATGACPSWATVLHIGASRVAP